MKKLRVVTGQGEVAIDEHEFRRRFRQRFFDPAFSAADREVERLADIAWEAYRESRKAPRTRRAGEGFADPDYELSVDWLEARARIADAQIRHDDPEGPSRILLISGSPRTDQSCPGERAKTHRLLELAREVVTAIDGWECDVLDLSRLTSEYGRIIHPCKGCVSTAMPLCHWPCSCYPNHALGQTPDWMNEIYPRWVAAHGVLVLSPVHWDQVPTVLKSMIDRLVCADGGNPDPTSTGGKDPRAAKALELKGWGYPRHLAGRAFSVVVHGDASGVDHVREALVQWLEHMGLVVAGKHGVLARYIGYLQPYAVNHDSLDADEALPEEVRNAARALVATVTALREGRGAAPDEALREPRPK
jgi:multimeric flavodoxin WrbA